MFHRTTLDDEACFVACLSPNELPDVPLCALWSRAMDRSALHRRVAHLTSVEEPFLVGGQVDYERPREPALAHGGFLVVDFDVRCHRPHDPHR